MASIISSVVSSLSITIQKTALLGRVVAFYHPFLPPNPLGYCSLLERWYFEVLINILHACQMFLRPTLPSPFLGL